MFFQSIIRKTVAGAMQSAGGFAEPVNRAFGIRVRTAAGNALELSHDDTNANINHPGTLKNNGKVIVGATSASGIYLLPESPRFGQECYITDLDMWVKYNGIEWQTLTGVSINDL